jgi:GNAT superfamily N-acetyltransferase
VDTVTIRPFAHDDSQAIAALWESLVEYHQALDKDLPRATPDGGIIYVERMISRTDDPNTLVLVAEIDGRVVGYVLGAIVDLVPDMFEREICGFIADIFVEPDHRRHGIGRLLMEAMLDWFQSEGIRYYEWYVAAQNPAARAFWREMGGRELMVRMRCKIKQDES